MSDCMQLILRTIIGKWRMTEAELRGKQQGRNPMDWSYRAGARRYSYPVSSLFHGEGGCTRKWEKIDRWGIPDEPILPTRRIVATSEPR